MWRSGGESVVVSIKGTCVVCTHLNFAMELRLRPFLTLDGQNTSQSRWRE